jgi:hypothetical protein
MTVDKTYVLATPHFDKHTTYVAMSRHKQSANLYASSKDFKSTAQLCSALSKKSDKLSTVRKGKTQTHKAQHETPSLREKISQKLKSFWCKMTGSHPEPQPILYDKRNVEQVLNRKCKKTQTPHHPKSMPQQRADMHKHTKHPHHHHAAQNKHQDMYTLER